VVLPEDALSDEIFDTELELQMARDTKSEYNWIDELLHVRYGNKVLKESIDRIAKRIRKSKEELRVSLEVLTFVDEYLAWAGQAGQYHKVPDDMEQAFGDLVSRMKARNVDRLSANAKSAHQARVLCGHQDRARQWKGLRGNPEHHSAHVPAACRSSGAAA
jgi:hypothetical protein